MKNTTINIEEAIQTINKQNKRIEELCLEIERLTRRIDKAIEYIRIYRSYQKIDNKDYLKGRDEIGCLDIYQVDELLGRLDKENK